MVIQATKEIANCAGADVVSSGVSLGLYINAVKAKSVLVYYSVHAIIARAAQGLTALFRAGTSVAHAEK